MRLTIIGCSGSVPGPDSPASCYLVQAEGYALVLDLGNGAFGPLQGRVGVDQLGAVLISHLHADHCVDLSALPVASQFGPSGRTNALPILGPAGLVDRVVGISGITDAADLRELTGMYDFGTVTEGTFALGPFEITARRVDHPVEAYAYRIAHEGRVLAYSGDCAPCPGIAEVARGADLALVEATYPDASSTGQPNSPGVHHTGREAGELAARGGVARLVLTHVPPWGNAEARVEAARSACDCPVDAARCGHTYDV